MSEALLNDHQPNLPPHVEEIQSDDGLVVVDVSPHGGQVWRGQIGGLDVLLPLNNAHSISTDKRPNPNSYPLGETTEPGGTWLSFGGGKVQNVNGAIVSEAPVHGPFSAAWNLFKHILRPNRIIMDSGVEGTAPFFLPEQKFGVHREVAAIEGTAGSNGAIEITNVITNLASAATSTPKAVEHAYFTSQAVRTHIDELSGQYRAEPVAGILNAVAGLTYPEELPHVEPGNGNVIDAHFDSAETGTPGRCVFLPDGKGGRVVVIDAMIVHPNGSQEPVRQFDIYRHQNGDPSTEKSGDGWTAIEPTMGTIRLGAGEHASLITTIQSFDSLDAYTAVNAA